MASAIPNLPSVLTNVLNALFAGRRFAIRKDVPFDAWFYKTTATSPNNARDNSLSGRVELAEAALMGAAYAVVESVRYVYSLFFKPNEANQHSKALKEQLHGAYLSTIGIYSAQSARMKFLEHWAAPGNLQGHSQTYIFPGNIN